jgi:hypothetical protein
VRRNQHGVPAGVEQVRVIVIDPLDGRLDLVEDRTEVLVFAQLDERREHHLRVAGPGQIWDLQRHPDLEILQGVEILRHHADDLHRGGVDAGGPAHDPAIGGEVVLPGLITDDRHRRGAGLAVGGLQRAAEERRHLRQHAGSDGRGAQIRAGLAFTEHGPAIDECADVIGRAVPLQDLLIRKRVDGAGLRRGRGVRGDLHVVPAVGIG